MKISVNGVELNYEVIGSGDPLIMVHGNSEDHTIFTEAAEVLKNHYTCYLVDTRSHGKSGKVKPLHYKDMAQDYVEFIKALELQNVTFTNSQTNRTNINNSNILILLLRILDGYSHLNADPFCVFRMLLLLFQKLQCQNSFPYCHRDPPPCFVSIL